MMDLQVWLKILLALEGGIMATPFAFAVCPEKDLSNNIRIAHKRIADNENLGRNFSRATEPSPAVI